MPLLSGTVFSAIAQAIVNDTFCARIAALADRGLVVTARTVAAAIAAMTFASQAWPATLNVEGGEVFINQGAGYRPAAGSMTVNSGDAVMAKAGGSAEIVYEDECRQRVDVGAVVVVQQTSPCAVKPTPDDSVYIIGGLAATAGAALLFALGGEDGKSASAQ